MENGEPDAVGLKREIGDNKIYVYGSGKNLDARVAVENPARWSAQIFKETLEKKGIAVEGEIKSADWRTENKSNVENLTELASVESQTLGEIVRKMNKDSVNLIRRAYFANARKKIRRGSSGRNSKTAKNARRRHGGRIAYQKMADTA